MMEKITLDDFKFRLFVQGVRKEHWAFICPMCGTVQTANELIRAGAGKTVEDVEKYLGFSCIGRFGDAKPPRKGYDGNPCNWTLGGLFALHQMEVVTPDGDIHPHFAPASPMVAKEHLVRNIFKGAPE